MIYIRYRMPGWSSWVVIPARDKAEANSLRAELRALGYQVE